MNKESRTYCSWRWSSYKNKETKISNKRDTTLEINWRPSNYKTKDIWGIVGRITLRSFELQFSLVSQTERWNKENIFEEGKKQDSLKFW